MTTATDEREATIAELVTTKGLNAVRVIARDEAKGDRERFKEYFALGSATLAEIAPRFDRDLATFNTYVHSYVRWAIRDHKRVESRDRRAERAVGIALRHFGATTEEPIDSISDLDEKTRAQFERYVRSAVGESVLAIEALDLDELVIANDKKASIQAMLAEMGEPAPRVWQVFFVEQMTTDEGAAALGVSRATATRQKKALRDALLERLAEPGDEPPV